MAKIGHPALGIYYDLGNATSHGYNPSKDIRKIGQFLVGVHIKDRKVGGGSFPLSEGDTDFMGGFQALIEIGYEGPFILETPRGVDPVDTARKHLDFVKRTMSQVVAEKGRK
jgi:hexulose-6-phosphate isomerase